MIQRLANSYPHARTIHLVLDNLNTHCRKSLDGHFGTDRPKALWKRFTIPKEHKWRYMFGVNEKALDGCVDPKQLPVWLMPEDLDYYVNEYSRTGFRSGLNWYRGQDIFWQETPFLIGRKLLQPTLYVGGTDDPVDEFARPYVDNLEKSVPNLRNKVLLRGIGHWTQQEAPTEVNRLMVDFLVSVDG